MNWQKIFKKWYYWESAWDFYSARSIKDSGEGREIGEETILIIQARKHEICTRTEAVWMWRKGWMLETE